MMVFICLQAFIIQSGIPTWFGGALLGENINTLSWNCFVGDMDVCFLSTHLPRNGYMDST